MMQRILLAAVMLLASINANAATLDIEAKQIGSDVYFFGTGSIDLTGFGTPAQIGLGFNESRPGRQAFGVINGALVDRYTVTGLFTSFTPLSNVRFDLESYSPTETGDAFYINGPRPFTRNYIRVTRGYSSLDPFSFTWIASDRILADLDLNYGTLAEFGNNKITLTGTPPTPVPVPASFGFLALGLLALWPFRRRFREAQG
ncbi:hypothetical protein ABVF61_15950 [Roseibium sp. HPY-6]|uniref:hypothetical protein n=1 Tax=Roseibium sp. HPY-6 TaxID=3229852 RepID=UPI00338F78B9